MAEQLTSRVERRITALACFAAFAVVAAFVGLGTAIDAQAELKLTVVERAVTPLIWRILLSILAASICVLVVRPGPGVIERSRPRKDRPEEPLHPVEIAIGVGILGGLVAAGIAATVSANHPPAFLRSTVLSEALSMVFGFVTGAVGAAFVRYEGEDAASGQSASSNPISETPAKLADLRSRVSKERDDRIGELVAASRAKDSPLDPMIVAAQLQEIEDDFQRQLAAEIKQ